MTNVQAKSMMTIDWLAQAPMLSIPVYQREYRWSLDSCERLLTDIRATADAPSGNTHFIGSILSRSESSTEATLVDGQQRITTLLLLIAALRDVVRTQDSPIADRLTALLVSPQNAGVSRLRAHERHVAQLDAVLLGAKDPLGDSTFEQNYRYFRSEVELDWQAIWAGLQRLEHVDIELTSDANPQQVFESLNSTGEALSDNELIHNYIHMGLTLDQQLQIERDFWVPIENSTEDHIGEFWRDFLIMECTSQPDLGGEHGVYRAFKERYPALTIDELPSEASKWKSLAESYGVLLHPSRANDPDVERHLSYLHTFGSTSFPLVLGLYGDYVTEVINKDTLISALEQVQSLFIRRALVGLGRDVSLVGPLCRERLQTGHPVQGLVTRAPEDYQVRLALTHRPVPHAGYVLQRLQAVDDPTGLQIEHIHPQTPNENWSGDGKTLWRDMTADTQSEYRSLLQTLGNVTLLEAFLNKEASNRSFHAKKDFYKKSTRVQENAQLATLERWDKDAIKRRTETLTQAFLRMWERPSDVVADEPENLVLVTHLEKKPLRRLIRDEFEYATFDGEVWGDIHDVKELYKQVFTRLWATRRSELLAPEYSQLIVEEKARRGQYHELDSGKYLFMGLFPQWLLHETQKAITVFGLESDVKVKRAEASLY